MWLHNWIMVFCNFGILSAHKNKTKISSHDFHFLPLFLAVLVLFRSGLGLNATFVWYITRKIYNIMPTICLLWEWFPSCHITFYSHCLLTSGGCCSNFKSVTILFHVNIKYTGAGIPGYAVIEYLSKLITSLVRSFQCTYFNIYSHKTRLRLHKTRLRNTRRSNIMTIHRMDKCLLRDKMYVLAYEHGKSILLAFDALCGYDIWVENALTSVNIDMK